MLVVIQLLCCLVNAKLLLVAIVRARCRKIVFLVMEGVLLLSRWRDVRVDLPTQLDVLVGDLG